MKVSFATFNAARLGVPKGKKTAPDDPQTQAARLEMAQSIKETDGDVLGLQEVRSEQSLDTFLAQHDLDQDYPHRQFYKTNDGGGNHLAILSRFPITASESHRKKVVSTTDDGKERKLTRDIAEAEIQVGSTPVKCYVVHLKADPYFEGNPTPEEMKIAENRRLDEQRLVQKVVAEDLPSLPSKSYVVMGDINDHTDSSTAQAFLSDESVPLTDPHSHLTGLESLSHPPSGRRLDVTYLSPNLAGKVVEGSAQVGPFRENGSDHAPVRVTVDLG